jgi:3-oxoacyl-[acyl-carrier protein] reductase
LFDEAQKAFDRVDILVILVNNAGIYKSAPLDAVTDEHFHKQFDLNVLELLFAYREAARRMGPNDGSIISISSAVSTLVPPNTAVYSATKASVDAITRVLSKELAPRKIRVNAINPGTIETEDVRTAGLNEGDMRQWMESTTPLGRIGQVGEIVPAAVFLASSDASEITGETLFISGGGR